ncbi:7-carboxy-7-deazaguanine synthase QueE [Halomonas denitrificans]|nr:7-carboxy-7-deazaguanine synthase QueE [Halomonas denitrificans]
MSSPTAAPHRSATELKITEIFRSLQGESASSGWPTTFVRLTGCPLRCSWCDTAYAFHGGEWWTVEAVLDRVERNGCRHVCVTGGEPLAQRTCLTLLARLCDAGHRVSLETSGALPVADVDPRVVKILDLKLPGSGEAARNDWTNLDHLQAHDEIKFVVADRADFDQAVAWVREHELERWTVWFSPVWEGLPPATLADWLLESGLDARLQVQLHKVLWGETPGV